jgi:putative chitobiose transport system substrate-binding protein
MPLWARIKRIMAWSMLLVFFPMVFFGCHSAQKVPQSRPDTIELTFWTLQMLNFSDYMRSTIWRYERGHPHIRITWVDVPFSEGEKKALSAMLGRKTPDVINLNPDFSAVLASRSALLDMNRWISPHVRSSFLPAAWHKASLGSTTFGIPWYLSTAVTLYNRDPPP